LIDVAEIEVETWPQY